MSEDLKICVCHYSKIIFLDETIPSSKIPCSGCGAFLQCADTGLPGYIPSEIFKGRTDNELKVSNIPGFYFLDKF